MHCKYCSRFSKNLNSLVQHEIRCKLNENRIDKLVIHSGRPHTEEAKQKMSQIALENWKKGKYILGFNGWWNDKSHTEATKEKISNSMIGNNNGQHRGDRKSYHNGKY